MVYVARTSAAYKVLRKIYDKPLWYKIKALHNEFKLHNPTLAVILPGSTIFLTAYSAFAYCLQLQEFNPKYSENIIILRPDDPRVEKICKTDNLKIRYDPLQPTLYVYST